MPFYEELFATNFTGDLKIPMYLSKPCIAWSETNTIAISYSYVQNSQDFCFPIYLIDPNEPKEYTVIYTEHESPIVQLIFTPSILSNYLISVDKNDIICFWKMKNGCINDMECFSKLSVENLFYLKPIHSISYQRLMKPMISSNLKDSFENFDLRLSLLPFGTLGFLSITKCGKLKFFKFENYNQEWLSNEIDLGITFDKCDFILIDNSVYIALVEKNSLEVHIFEWNFVSIKTQNHYKILIKPENQDLLSFELLDLKFSIYSDLFIASNTSIQKWNFDENEKLWKLNSELNKTGKMKVSKSQFYLHSSNQFEKYSLDLKQLHSSIKKRENEENETSSTFDTSVNDICVGFLNYKNKTLNLTLYLEKELSSIQQSNLFYHCIFNKFEFWDVLISIKFNKNMALCIEEIQKIKKMSGSSRIMHISSSMDRFVSLIHFLKGNNSSSIDICSTLYLRYIIEIFRDKIIKPTGKEGNEENEKKRVEHNDLSKEDLIKLTPFVHWAHKFTIFFFKSLRYLFSEPKKAYCKELVRHPRFIIILKEIFTYTYIISKQTKDHSILDSEEMQNHYKAISSLLKLVTSSHEKQNPKSDNAELKSIIFSETLKIKYPKSYEEILSELDFVPHFQGILSNSVPSLKNIDVITIVKIDNEHRVCRLCGRVSTFNFEGCFSRWEHACLYCGSNWKFISKE
eukprot:gene8692-639_t